MYEHSDMEEQARIQSIIQNSADIVNLFDEFRIDDQLDAIESLHDNCKEYYDSRIPSFFIFIINSDDYFTIVRAKALKYLFHMYQLKKEKDIEVKIEKALINFLSEKLSFKKNNILDSFQEFVEYCMMWIVEYFTESIKIKKLLGKYSFSLKNSKLKNISIEALAKVDFLGNIKNFFEGLYSEENIEVRTKIHGIVRNKIGNEISWDDIKQYFSEERMIQIFTNLSLEDQKLFVETIGLKANPNPLYEKFFLDILKKNKGDLALQKVTAKYIGKVGDKESIVFLSSISKNIAHLQDDALKGLSYLARKYRTSVEKLVEENYHSLKKRSYWILFSGLALNIIGFSIALLRIFLPINNSSNPTIGIVISTISFTSLGIFLILITFLDYIKNWNKVKRTDRIFQ